MVHKLPENPLVQGEDLLLDVKVTPGVKESQVVGWKEGYLVVRVTGLATKGKANETLILTLAKAFSLKKSQVEIVGGATSRIKRIRLSKCSQDLLSSIWMVST